MVKDQTVVPVPRHQEIKRGTLMAIITEAGLTKEKFLKLLVYWTSIVVDRRGFEPLTLDTN